MDSNPDHWNWELRSSPTDDSSAAIQISLVALWLICSVIYDGKNISAPISSPETACSCSLPSHVLPTLDPDPPFYLVFRGERGGGGGSILWRQPPRSELVHDCNINSDQMMTLIVGHVSALRVCSDHPKIMMTDTVGWQAKPGRKWVQANTTQTFAESCVTQWHTCIDPWCKIHVKTKSKNQNTSICQVATWTIVTNQCSIRRIWHWP